MLGGPTLQYKVKMATCHSIPFTCAELGRRNTIWFRQGRVCYLFTSAQETIQVRLCTIMHRAHQINLIDYLNLSTIFSSVLQIMAILRYIHLMSLKLLKPDDNSWSCNQLQLSSEMDGTSHFTNLLISLI